MAISMNLRDLRNPQYTSVTGRKSKTPYSTYLTAMGPSVRAAAQQSNLDALREKESLQQQTQFNTELKQSQEQFDTSQALEREKLDVAKDQASKGQTMQGASTILSATALANQAGLINLKDIAKTAAGKVGDAAGKVYDAAGKVYDTATGANTTAPAATNEAGPIVADMSENAGVQTTQYAETVTPTSESITPTLQDAAAKKLASTATTEAAPVAGEVATLSGGAPMTEAQALSAEAGWETGATAASQTAAGAGATTGATLSSIAGGVMSAAPYIAAWKFGMPILKDIMKKGSKEAFGVDPEGSSVVAQQNRIAGDVQGVITPAYREIFREDPPEIFQALSNPAGYLAKQAGCIIVTACTNRDSYEVEIARTFRDQFLDADQLRGYYALAERIVPMLERNEKARKNVKKWLVDRLIDYGAYRLGLKDTQPRWSSVAVSGAFLKTIKIIGMILPRYVRANGEVY
jgi:hypothetical protein